jgi:hypothetical protein
MNCLSTRVKPLTAATSRALRGPIKRSLGSKDTIICNQQRAPAGKHSLQRAHYGPVDSHSASGDVKNVAT